MNNSSERDLIIERVVASCSCVTFDEYASVVRGRETLRILGTVDTDAAPNHLVISIVGNGELHQVGIAVAAHLPEWDRGVIYREHVVLDSDLGELAGVYLNGTRPEVESRLRHLEYSGQGIRGFTWSEPRPVEDIEGRWYSGLRLHFDSEAGPEPVTGVLNLEGVRIRVVIAFEPR